MCEEDGSGYGTRDASSLGKTHAARWIRWVRRSTGWRHVLAKARSTQIVVERILAAGGREFTRHEE